MQRRTGHPATSSPNSPSQPAVPHGGSNSRSGSGTLNRRKKKKLNPVLLLLLVASVLLVASWYLFPAQVLEVEKEAEHMTTELAKKAIRAEHKVEDWLHHQEQQAENGESSSSSASSSLSATERMLAQSSTWVDGEKKLKQQLSKLAKLQQDSKLLGVPVLTRYLGKDFPAWVTPEMDEAEWREKVKAKYAEMRTEEEEWKKEMQALINQREQDIGITTA